MDSLQRPVKISQVFTTPSESIEKAKPSFACRLTALIGAEVGSKVSISGAPGFADGVLICQNLTDLSKDAEMRIREEGKTREVILSVCPMRV